MPSVHAVCGHRKGKNEVVCVARKARVQSVIGIYHVLLRGVNVLFAQEADYSEFTSLLGKYKSAEKFNIFSYTLLANRIHLIIETRDDVGRALKPLCTSYARYFNRTYSRDGKLFYDRLKSEPISSDYELANAVAFVNEISTRTGEVNPYCSLSRQGRALVDDSRLTPEELKSTHVTEMFIEDYDCLSQKEIDSYIYTLSGTHPKDFKKLDTVQQAEAIMRLTKKRWIARTKLEKLLGIKKARPKATAERQKQPEKKEALSFWLL